MGTKIKRDKILSLRKNAHLFLPNAEPDEIMPLEEYKKAVDVLFKKCGFAPPFDCYQEDVSQENNNTEKSKPENLSALNRYT